MARLVSVKGFERLESLCLLAGLAFEPNYVQPAARTDEVRLADLDGDQDLDLITASGANQSLHWYTNDGHGVFSSTAQQIDLRAGAIIDVLAGDVDRDGDIDLVVSAQGNVRWYENTDGRAAFSQPHTIVDGEGTSWNTKLVDLDGDLDLDLITTFSERSGAIAWHENLGGGQFSESRLIVRRAEYAWLKWLDAADVDHDGDQDLVFTSAVYDGATSTVTVEWIENENGPVRFSAPDTLYVMPPNSSPHELLVTDLDHDGLLDLLSRRASNGIELARQTPGQLTFTQVPNAIPHSGNSSLLGASDWNGDGLLDLVSADPNHRFVWMPSQSDVLTPYTVVETVDPEARYYSRIELGDIDGDGYADLVVLDYESLHTYRFDAAQQAFERRVIEQDHLPIESVQLADLNEDGWQDLITSVRVNRNHYRIDWYRNQNGLGDFDQPRTLATFDTPLRQFSLVDLDNDQHLDLVWMTADQVAWQRRTAESVDFQEPVAFSDLPRLNAFDVTDLDRDGDADLVALSEDYLHVVRNLGDGQVQSQVVDRFDRDIDGLATLAVGDLDSDGDLDILVPANLLQLVWYEQLPDGESFQRRDLLGEFNDLLFPSIDILDLNGDQRDDVLVSADGLWWIEQTPTGFGPRRLIDEQVARYRVPGARNAFTVVADIDGDLDLDIGAIGTHVERASSVERIVWYENLGNGQYASAIVADSIFAGGESQITSGDLNGDRRTDLVFATADGEMVIFEQRTLGDVDGNGAFDSADLVALFQRGSFENGLAGSADFSSGDWNRDGEFDSSDLVLAFQAGHYQSAPNLAHRIKGAAVV